MSMTTGEGVRMLEWLVYLELLSKQMAGSVLALPGLLGLLLGIFLWLGGSLGRRGLLALMAMMTGALVGFWIAGSSGVLVGSLGLGMVALALPRLATGIVASLWIAIATVAFLVAAQSTAPEAPMSFETLPSSSLNGTESRAALLDHVAQLGGVLWQAIRGQAWPVQMVLPAVLVAVTSIMALLPRLGLALCHAVMGTGLVTVGMGFLLLYKGSEPLFYAWSHYSLFGAIWASMVLFGTTIQLICCGRRRSMRVAWSGRRNRRLDMADVGD